MSMCFVISWKKINIPNLLTVSGWSTDVVGVYDDSTWYYIPLVTTGFESLQYTIYFVFVYLFPYALLVSFVIATIVTNISKKYKFEFNKLKKHCRETIAFYILCKMLTCCYYTLTKIQKVSLIFAMVGKTVLGHKKPVVNFWR